MTDNAASVDLSVRDVLRQRTQETHSRLHEHSSFVGLFKGTLGFGDYRRLTQRLHGFYAPLDQAIVDVIGKGGTNSDGYDYAPRSGYLAQDMADMGFSDQQICDSLQCQQAFDFVSPATLAGVLYVVEGATLGGSMIDRAAQKLLGKDQAHGRMFWSWCRSQNKRRWQLINQYLEDLNVDRSDLDAIATAAQDTFQIFGDWIAPLDQAVPAAERVNP